MDVEINRRRSNALAVLRRRGDARGKLGLRLPAARRTAIERALVFGDLDQPLGQVEHLSSLHPRLHRRSQDGAAAAARLRFVPHHPIRRLDLPERVALVSRLPAAFLARAPAKAAGDARLLLQPVARRRLGAVRTVQVQSSPKLGVLRPKLGVLRPKRRALGSKRCVPGPQALVLAPKLGVLAPQSPDQLANFGGIHPNLDLCLHRTCRGLGRQTQKFHRTCGNSDLPSLGVTPFRVARPLRGLRGFRGCFPSPRGRLFVQCTMVMIRGKWRRPSKPM